MNTFKTLAEARGAYNQLAAELAETQKKTAQLAELEAQLDKLNAEHLDSATENQDFRLLIIQKDQQLSDFKAENAALSTQISDLKTELEASQKQQKTAKLHARELVAASGGAPIAVDQAEISRMQAGDEKDYLAQMAKTTDPAELSRLYREYNRIFRANGKHKKN